MNLLMALTLDPLPTGSWRFHCAWHGDVTVPWFCRLVDAPEQHSLALQKRLSVRADLCASLHSWWKVGQVSAKMWTQSVYKLWCDCKNVLNLCEIWWFVRPEVDAESIACWRPPQLSSMWTKMTQKRFDVMKRLWTCMYFTNLTCKSCWRLRN